MPRYALFLPPFLRTYALIFVGVFPFHKFLIFSNDHYSLNLIFSLSASLLNGGSGREGDMFEIPPPPPTGEEENLCILRRQKAKKMWVGTHKNFRMSHTHFRFWKDFVDYFF